MWFSLLHEAMISISSNRLRTFLAMLGIVIGVGSVVSLVAIGTGSSRAIEASIAKLGSNMLIVTPGSRESKGINYNSYSDLTINDVKAIAQLPEVLASSPSTRRDTYLAVVGRNNWSTEVNGVSPDFFFIRDWQFADGENFNEEDVKFATRVAVIGKTVAEKLFPDANPLGQTLRINGISFRISGVLESKGQSLNGKDQDDGIYMPYTTVQRKLIGRQDMNGLPIIFVKVAADKYLDSASYDINELLRERHHVRAAEEDRYTVRSMSSITATTSETSKALSLLLGAIASISLIVGGIGIMNIMLVTVTERTREIGIRKALGATRSDVLWQFLLEAVVIAAVGSIVGLVLGTTCALALEKWMGMNAEFTLWSILAAFLVAVLIGIISGLYPAHRASILQPIDALRQVGG